ncbi:MAG: hypothetical protein QXW35_05075 [Candidatus Aenigmatarchaeota archaeon]
MFFVSVITLIYAGVKIFECIEYDEECDPKIGAAAGVALDYIIKSILKI